MRWEMECILRPGVGLRKRTGPSITFRIVGRWYKGDRFIAVDSKTVGKYTWYKIEGTEYWSCGQEGSAKYLKKIRDLDPPKPPDPPPPPPKPAPKPEPPYIPPVYNDGQMDVTWNTNQFVDDWYVHSRLPIDRGESFARARMGYGRWDQVSDDEISEEIRRIKYNMDIAYMQRGEVFGSSASGGYYSDLQPKIHTLFNRNKTTYADYHLNKTFAYVFFTRPDLNICESDGDRYSLSPQAKMDPMYDYIMKNNDLTIRSLTDRGINKHKLMPLLSNEAKSYEVADQVIKTVEHGETYTGSKVVYGRTDHESRSAGEMSVRYIDGVNLDIFKLHLIWVDYISKVSNGIFSPKIAYIRERILDYACSCYYVLCGADGSTILYWEKLTGVFPLNTGSNAFSWDSGTLLAKPEINIKYQYSMKTPMNIAHLYELNQLAGFTNMAKIKNTYSSFNCASGSTMTHIPCVVPSSIGGKTIHRLMWSNYN